MRNPAKPSEICSNLGSAELILAQQIVIREMASLLHGIDVIFELFYVNG